MFNAATELDKDGNEASLGKSETTSPIQDPDSAQLPQSREDKSKRTWVSVKLFCCTVEKGCERTFGSILELM